MRSLVLRDTRSFVQNSMYRGAMEPIWTSGGCPGGGCADWAVSRKQEGLSLGPNLDHCATTNYNPRLTTTTNKAT